ncbi:MAG: hypothetical protein FD153_163, partial [Rhodospirillaceae bacterium]
MDDQQDPDPEREEALARLRERIQEINSGFPGEADPWGSPPGAAEALGALMDFVRPYGIPVWPVLMLLGALANLQAGWECPMLTPPKPDPLEQ